MKRSAVRELLKLTVQPDMISFAGGLPATELFPTEEVAEATAGLFKERGGSALQYGETEGVGELRDWVAREYSVPGFGLRRSNVLITTGAQQALDLLGRVFLDEGDRVWVENPTYLAALSAWRPLGVEFQVMASDAGGPVADEIARGRAKLAYLVPNFQNPTGRTISESRRVALVDAMLSGARAGTGTIGVEDDPYGELRYEGVPGASLFALAGARVGAANPILRVGTFSKVLVPGLRVGWVLGPEPVIDVMVRAKQAADLHTSTLSQWLILELLRRGVLQVQREKLIAAYRERRDAMLESLARLSPEGVSWTRPEGGMFIWVTLPEGRSAQTLLAGAVRRGVAFVPGDDFHVGGGGRNTLRLNFTHPTPDRIREGVQRLGAALRELAA